MTELADELLTVVFDEEPLLATLVGMRSHDDRLRDLRPEAVAAVRERAEEIARRACALDDSALSTDDRITRALIVQQAGAVADRAVAGLVEHTVAIALLAPGPMLLLYLPMTTTTDEESERAYLARLAAIPEFLQAAIERHRAGLLAGRAPLARHVKVATGHLDRYLADPDGDPLRLPALSGDRVAERERLLVEMVRPAFVAYRDVLSNEIAGQGRADDQPGLCWLSGGAEIYAGLIRVNTTTHHTADELHQIGIELIEQLDKEYREIGSRVFGEHTAAEVRDRLRTDPALRWKDGEELLANARATIERAERASTDWFGRLPMVGCAVEPVPPNEAPNAAAAYYIQPPVDGTRPGTYYANTHEAHQRNRYTSEATAFHEAVPGHHFQLTLALERTELPLLRRFANIEAYIEGWALYTERLADEMGLYSNDLARLGMLAQDSMRAARLVVDTGLHAMGWSRQRTVEYLRDNTVMNEVEIQFEVDRYIECPGQALAYMVGRLEILHARADAQRRLGARFDIKAFHDLILGTGIVPLTALADLVAQWEPAVP